jgi:hypothetical protein
MCGTVSHKHIDTQIDTECKDVHQGITSCMLQQKMFRRKRPTQQTHRAIQLSCQDRWQCHKWRR